MRGPSKRQRVARFVSDIYRGLERANVEADSSYGVGYWADELMSAARTLHREAERQCNGFQDWRGNWDESASKRSEKREEKAIARAKAAAEVLGASLYVQGDPRGCPLYIYWPGDLRDGESIEAYYPQRALGVPTL